MNIKKIALLILVVLGIVFIAFLSINKESETSSNELDEANVTKMQEIRNCFEVNLATNISCRIYDFTNNGVVDIFDLTAFTKNLSLKTRKNITE